MKSIFKVKKKSIKKIELYLSFLIIAFTFLKPAGIEAIGYHYLNDAINILELIIICILLFQKGNFLKCNHFFTAEIFFFLVWILCYCCIGNNLEKVIKIGLNAIGIELLVEKYISDKRKLEVLVECFVFIHILLLAFNSYWLIVVNQGQFGFSSFIESKNGTTSYIITAYLFGILQLRLRKKNISKEMILIIILSILNVFFLESAGAVIGTALCIIYLVFLKQKKLNVFLMFWTSIITNIGVTFFGLQRLFSFLITKVLQRDISMTGRSILWKKGLLLFAASPIFGVGEQAIFLDNIVINIMTRGGILLLLAFVVMMYNSAVHNISKISKSSYVQDCSILFFVIIILSIAEAWCNFRGFYIVLSFFANSYRIKDEKYMVNQL